VVAELFRDYRSRVAASGFADMRAIRWQYAVHDHPQHSNGILGDIVPKREAMANIIVMAAAHTNSVFVACADRVGRERGQSFIGQSLIVSHTGWPLAGPASFDREEMIMADVNLADARRKRTLNEFNQLLRDRRTDVYAEMLGAKAQRGWY
jgi:predicted amidohydrolase